jgi:ribosomal protein L29
VKSKALRKRERESNTVLKVPNTPEGQQFLADFRKYRVSGVRVWARARGPRAVHARAAFADKVTPERLRFAARWYDQDLPREHATYWGVYVWKPTERSRQAEEYRNVRARAWELEKRVKALESVAIAPEELRAEVASLRRDKAILTQQRDQALAEARDQQPANDNREVKRLNADRAELMRQRDLTQKTNDRLREHVRELKAEVLALRAVRRPGGILN